MGLPVRKGHFCCALSGLPKPRLLQGRWIARKKLFQKPFPLRTTSAYWQRRSSPIRVNCLAILPQAFSHIGLVNAAWAISQRETAHDSSGA